MVARKPLNRSLGLARATKQDEFYTQLSDIEKELRHYCWRRLRRAKSGGGVPLYFGDWIKISLAADFSKSGESPVPGFGAVR
jgi:hypothetical protein